MFCTCDMVNIAPSPNIENFTTLGYGVKNFKPINTIIKLVESI